MASSGAIMNCCVLLATLLAAAGAAAQQTENLAFLPPVHQLPGLAKPGAHLHEYFQTFELRCDRRYAFQCTIGGLHLCRAT